MWFGRKNKEDVSKTRGYFEVIEELMLRLVDVEAKMEKYKQDVDSIRGLVNRKLGNILVDSDSRKEKYKSDDGLDELREIYGKEKNSSKTKDSIG